MTEHIAIDVEFGTWLVQVADLAWFGAMKDCLDSLYLWFGLRMAGACWIIAGELKVS